MWTNEAAHIGQLWMHKFHMAGEVIPSRVPYCLYSPDDALIVCLLNCAKFIVKRIQRISQEKFILRRD